MSAARTLVRRIVAGITATTGGRVLLFGLIGLSGFIPNLTTLAVVTEIAHGNYVVGTIVATQVAIAWNFLLLENLAYRRRQSGSVTRRAAQFFALNNADLLVRIPMLTALVELAHLGYLIATVVTLVVMFAVRFLVTDRLIYRWRRRSGPIALDFGGAGGVRPPMAVEEG